MSYYLIFAIGTLNRETTCFLTLICIFILSRKEKGRNLIFHGLLQFLIWISIKIYLYHLFIANRGDGFIETKHLKDNVEFSDPSNQLSTFIQRGDTIRLGTHPGLFRSY